MNGSNSVLINLMIRHEEVISRLYKAFSMSLPMMGKFWEHMALEEQGHADILRNLGKKVAEGKLSFNIRKISADQLLKTVDYLESTASRVEKKGIKLRKALEFAIECENSILESDCFEVFEGDSPEVKHDFELLNGHTKQHQNRLEQALKAAQQ